MARSSALLRIVPAADRSVYTNGFARHLKAANLAPRTVQTYLEGVTRFFEFLELDRATNSVRNLSDVRRSHVEAFIGYVLEHGTPATAANRFRSLQQFFRWALDEDEIARDPMARLHPPVIPASPAPVLRDDELKRLLAACAGQSFEDKRDEAIVRLFIATGARLAEIANMRWTPDHPETNDVALDDGLIRVMGKGRRERTIVVGSKAVRALGKYLRLRPRHHWAALPALWLAQRGAFTPGGVGQMVERRGERAGVKVHPHLFRHAYAHSMLSAGMQESDLMMLAGWKTPEMLRRYAAATAAERAILVARRLNPGDRI